MSGDARELLRRASGLHAKLADAIGNPSRVWCQTCGRSRPVDAAKSLAHGWPKCCGYTMTIAAPTAPTDGD
jgi:hypothetical protein